MAEAKGEQGSTQDEGLSLGTRILIGVLAGIAVGLFLGDLSSPLKVVGDIYVGLLQMTVLPYVFVSLVSRIGRFTFERAAEIAKRGMAVQSALWIVGFAPVVLLPYSLPDWQAGTFFSASLVESGASFDFLRLYLPTNPFGAFADNLVPAVVLFSILLGIALIPLPNKSRLLDPLEVGGDAMGAIARGVFRLSPWGTFALAASAVGTTTFGELLRIAGYVIPFTIAVVLIAAVLFPALVASLTPFGYREVMMRCRASLLTALATGKMYAVLPLIISDVRALLTNRGVQELEARSTAGVLVPLAYPFPNAGKLLAILFVPSAAWFVGRPLGLEDYPLLLSAGLLSFFGSPVAAMLFLLGLFRLPADLLALFLLAGIWGARVGDTLGVMHLTCFSLLTASSELGWLRVQRRKAVFWLSASVVAVIAAMWLNHALVSWTITGEPPPANRVVAMRAFFEGGAVAPRDPIPRRGPRKPGESALERIRRTGELRVGYLPNNAPFSYANDEKMLVGLEVDLMYRLAVELDAELLLVPYSSASLDDSFAADRFDLAIGGLGSFVREPVAYRESDRHLELNAALVVRDHRVAEFESVAKLREMDRLRVAFVEGGVLVRTGRHRLPGIEVLAIPSDEGFLRAGNSDFDALLTTAESGAIHTMIYPDFSVVIPDGFRVRVPIIIAVTEDDELVRAVNRFINIKRADGTIEALHAHWILGRATIAKGRRWSVVRDVLGYGL